MPRTAYANESTALFEAAQVFSEEVLHDFEEERWQLFSLHAGAAVEFLAKATLAEANPLLLADASGPTLTSTLIALQRPGASGEERVRTVNLDGAMARLRALYPQLQVDEGDIRALSAARNAAVHLGRKSRDRRLPLLLIFLRSCSALLSLTGRHEPSFWGLYRALPAIVGDNRPARLTEAQVRIQMARCRSSDSEQREVREARARSAAAVLRQSHEEAAPCPICGCQALYSGDHAKVGEKMHFQPQDMHCHGCELRLRGVESLHLAGVSGSWPTSRSEGEIAEAALWVGE